MKTKSITPFLVFLLLVHISLIAQNRHAAFSKTDSVLVFNSKINLQLKQKMLDRSFANNSTAPNFVVIIATDKISGKTKEVCTEAPFVEGGIERNIGKEKNQTYKSQHFYFNTKSALNNIGFYEYTYDELLEYGQNKEVRLIVADVLKSGKDIQFNFQNSRKQQFMFAHILFNNGIMCTRGDVAGNFMTLSKFK